MKSSSEKAYPLVDILKLLLVLLFLGLNTKLFGDTKVAYYIYTVICRISVPFLLFGSGYFLASKINDDNRNIIIKDFIKKTGILYLFLATSGLAIELMKNNDFSLFNILTQMWKIITCSSSNISWFMGTLFLSGMLVYFINTKRLFQNVLKLFFVLFVVGLLFNTYDFLIINNNFKQLYEFLHGTFNNNINFLFSGFLFFGLGYYFKLYNQDLLKKSRNIWYILCFIGMGLLFLESRVVSHHLGVIINYDYFFSHLLIIPSLFILALTSKINDVIKLNTNYIGKLALYIFYLSGYVLDLLFLYQVYKLESIFDNNLIMFLGVLIISSLLSCLLIRSLKKDNYERLLSVSLVIYSIIIIIFSLMILLNNSIWADEACSLAMLRHSLFSIVKLNIHDVHPPLYHWLIRLFLPLLEKIFPFMSSIVAAKLLSFIPLLILVVICFTKIRKEYGYLASSIFLFFMVGMPSMMQYFGEARMYSWAMCFTTIAYIYMADILKKNDKKSWIVFVIFSLLSAYSHLYSCLCIVLFFIYLFVVSLIRKDKNFFVKWFISGLTTFILYLPWIIVVLFQIKTVSGGFWIPEITMRDFIGYFQFIFYAQTLDAASGSLLTLTLIFIIWLVFIYYLLSKDKKVNKAYASLGIVIPFIVMTIGIVVSKLITPLFVSRYLFPSLGCLWFIMAILISKKVSQKNSISVLFIIFVISASASINYLLRYEIVMTNNESDYRKYQEKIPEDALIVSDYTHLQMVEAYYHPNKTIYCYECSNEKMIDDLFGNIKDNITIDDIVNFVNEGKTIYFIRYDFGVNYVKLFEQHGINYEISDILYEDWYGMQMIILNGQ